MLPTRWTPFRELSSLHRDIDELFQRAFGRHETLMPWLFRAGERFPAIDCTRKGNDVVVRAELPGIDPKQVEISITGNLLTIRGERKAEKETREEDYSMHEITRGAFERTLTLPEGVNTEKVKAGYRDGILEIKVPAKAVAKAKKIEIVAEEQPKTLKAA